MRLFVAIDPDDRAREAIAVEQRRIAGLAGSSGRGSSPRWVRPEQLHLTVVFLGEVDKSRVPAAVAACSEPIPQPAFDLIFDHLGLFPPSGAPRALWLGAAQGEAELGRLAAEIADRLERAGFRREQRPFRPHLTLARWKTSRPSDRGRLLSTAQHGAIARVRVESAILYSSRLSAAGPSYAELARATLTVLG